jgi:hypothetical protein
VSTNDLAKYLLMIIKFVDAMTMFVVVVSLAKLDRL